MAYNALKNNEKETYLYYYIIYYYYYYYYYTTSIDPAPSLLYIPLETEKK